MVVLRLDEKGNFVYTNGHLPFNTLGKFIIDSPIILMKSEEGYNLQVYHNGQFVFPNKIYVYLSGNWVEPRDILVCKNNAWVSIKKS